MSTDIFRRFLGRILDAQGEPVGTCFQIAPGFLVSAYHVIAESWGDSARSTVEFVSLAGSGQTGMKAIARIEKQDSANDLVLLRTDQPLPGSISHLSRSGLQQPNTPVRLGGYATLRGSSSTHEFRFLETTGTWEAESEDSDGTLRGIVHADGTALGMSGCPVVRVGDGAVIGVLSQRFKGEEGWGDYRAWVSRVEDLERLCIGVVEIPLEQSPAPVTASEGIRLSEVSCGREELQNDPCFVNDQRWSAPWAKATGILQAGDVLVVSGLPGVGTTTFAEHVLALNSPKRTRLVRLDPGDWDTPIAAALPQQPWSAYILDLRDPESDQPKQTFLHDLNLLAPWYRDMKIQLVITIADDLWHGQNTTTFPRIQAVSLDHAPDPQELVQRYVSRKADYLTKVVARENVAQHLKRRNAVQAMEAVSVVLQEHERLTTELAADQLTDHAGDDDHRVSTLAKRVEERLDDHHEILDALFAGTEHNRAESQPSSPEDPAHERRRWSRLSRIASAEHSQLAELPIEDRCLLIALAYRSTARLSRLEADARRLESILSGAGNVRKDEKGNAKEALSGTGLRGRVHRIQATVGQSEIATFERDSFGPAAIQYVWDNYSPARQALAKWLIDVAAEGPDEEKRAAQHLSALLRRHQDVDFIKNHLHQIALDQGCPGLLIDIIYDAATDEHMQRRCERLLYQWSERADLQPIVLEVCARLLSSDRRNIALRRLRRVANADKTSQSILNALLDHWRSVAEDTRLGPWFRDEVSAWFKADTGSVSAKLAFTALLGSTAADGVPWLLSAQQQALPHADEMLGEVLVGVSSAPRIGATIAGLVEKAGADDVLYNRAIDRIVAASVANGVIRQIWDLGADLQRVGSQIGRDPRADIQSRLDDYRAAPVTNITAPLTPTSRPTIAPDPNTPAPEQPSVQPPGQ